MAEKLWEIPNSVRTVMLYRVSSESDAVTAAEVTGQATRIMTFLMLLGMPLSFSIMHMMMRVTKDPSDLTIGFYPLAIAVVPMIGLTFVMGGFEPFAPAHLVPLVVSAVCITVGFVTVSKAYHMGDASLVAPVQYTQMIWGGILGAMLFGDLPDIWMIVGSGIIIVSGLYLLHQEHSNAS